MATSVLSFNQIQVLWIANGGTPGWAPLAAGIAIAESGGNTTSLNNTPATGDYSVGLWQINYYNGLLASRTASYGPPGALQIDANAQAKAAVSLSGNGTNWGPWKTDHTWNAWVNAGRPRQPSAATVLGWIKGGTGGSTSSVSFPAGGSGSYGSAPVGPIGENYATIPSASTPTQGFGNLTIGDITINAGPLDPNFAAAVTNIIVERNIASSSTVTIQIADPLRQILRSEIYTYNDILEMDGLLFALVQITKTGDQLQYIFEAYGVFLLRQQKGSIATATTTNITGFAEQLVRAIPGLGFIGQVDRLAGAPAVAVGRGTTTNKDEDSWTALVRVAATAGWRVFESNNVIHFGSDPFWMTFPSVATLQEFTTNIYNIDFDYDIGQPFGNVTVTGVANLLDYPPGSVVTLLGMGPASTFGGLWLVNDMQRDFFSPEMTLTLQSPISVELFLNPSQNDLGITGINASSVA